MAGVAAIVVAAGQGLRAGGDLPKQFRRIGGKAILRRTVLRLLEVPEITAIQPVTRPEDRSLAAEDLSGLAVREPVPGGATRQDSVRAGLTALEALGPGGVG